VAADFVRPMTRTTKKAIDALSDDDIRLWTAFWQGDGSFYYASGCRLAQSLRNAPAMLAWWFLEEVGGQLYVMYRDESGRRQIMIGRPCDAEHMRWIGKAMLRAGHLDIKKHEVELMLRRPQGTRKEWRDAHAKVRPPCSRSTCTLHSCACPRPPPLFVPSLGLDLVALAAPCIHRPSMC
jgi:hypothetical protein